VTASVLLDTHTFLWWTSQHGVRLSAPARDVISSEDSEVLISVVTAWELAIKAAAGRIDLPEPVDRYIPRRIRKYRLRVLDVTLAHALRAASLPTIHRDPFDRMLVAQAQVEGIPLVTNDPAITRYDVETIW
jgi:PIN domain nuclease of toxin-antitoxin system